ncbi:MAG: ABC transporter ATP-binding protein [Candidatus Rokuibacteriota bacterium]|nr:MAG: ABC transporter ATP-binding protein [Candidatus Rokubacteria bacterium]PYN90659.1 MAG: ABC transporter ATP-binding protein [Candidatus Rokubacteria bacterium]
MATMAFRDVSKVFGTGARARVVLEECSFEVTRGKLNVLIGPSGCGKTTTVNLLAGYERATRGDVTLDGQPVHGPSWTRLVVFQETALFPWMTVLDNVTFGPTVRGMMARRAARDQALSLLEKVGLKDFAGRYPAHLSGGMQRRAELARAIINDPRVMLMDEPFRGLDAITRQLMQEYVLRLFEESRCTSLFVTSELEEAIFLADRLIILTNRPTRVKKIMEVDLPRPRSYQVLASPRYLALKEEALDALHEEALQAFAAGSTGAYDLVDAYRRRAGND